MDETPAQARLRVHHTIRTFTSGSIPERNALEAAVMEEFGVGLGQAAHSAQFERFHVVVLASDGTVVHSYDEPVDDILFDTSVELKAAVAAAEVEYPGHWIEAIGVLHGGRPWCPVRPLNRPMGSHQVLDSLMEAIASPTWIEPDAPRALDEPRPVYAYAA